MTIYINKDTGVHWTEADIARMAYPLREGIENGSYKVIVAISAPSIERSESPTPAIDTFLEDMKYIFKRSDTITLDYLNEYTKAVREDIRRLGK